MKEFTIRKGERARILHLISDHIPQLVRFSAAPLEGKGKVSGKIEVRGSRFIFRKPPVEYDLGPKNVVEKGMWETFYSVYVTPDQDIRLGFDSRHLRFRHLLYALMSVVVLAAVAVFAMALIRAGQ